jgi:hypothetical protein
LKPMRPLSCALAVALFFVAAPSAAQSTRSMVIGAGAGGTFYCIVSRCDSGTIVAGMASLDITRLIAAELRVGRHYCFDCDRFVIAEPAVVLQYPRNALTPYVAGGISYSSDPGFMGNQTGLAGAAGAWIWPDRRWSLRFELRGRQVGRGDAMGELSLAVARRFVRDRT